LSVPAGLVVVLVMHMQVVQVRLSDPLSKALSVEPLTLLVPDALRSAVPHGKVWKPVEKLSCMGPSCVLPFVGPGERTANANSQHPAAAAVDVDADADPDAGGGGGGGGGGAAAAAAATFQVVLACGLYLAKTATVQPLAPGVEPPP